LKALGINKHILDKKTNDNALLSNHSSVVSKAHSAESDNPSKQHRRLSAQNVLQRPAKARKAKEMPGASVDFATWTEQVRKNCHFDAGALSRGMKPKGSKEIERRGRADLGM